MYACCLQIVKEELMVLVPVRVFEVDQIVLSGIRIEFDAAGITRKMQKLFGFCAGRSDLSERSSIQTGHEYDDTFSGRVPIDNPYACERASDEIDSFHERTPRHARNSDSPDRGQCRDARNCESAGREQQHSCCFIRVRI